MAAHQLRTPLASLLIALQLLQRKNISASRRAEMTEVAKNEGDRIKHLADQLLDWEKIEAKSALMLAPVSIVAATRALVTKYQVTDQEQHQFHIDAPKPEPIVDADLDAVEQILNNLIDNAIKYSPANSTITIAFALAPENRVDISVRDQGSGHSVR